MNNKPKRQREEKNDKDVVLANISHRNTIIIAILGLIGTVITAYFGYLGSRPIEQTEQEKETETPIPSSLTPLTTISTTSPTSSSFATQTIEIISDLPRDPSTGYIVIYPSCNCLNDLTELKEFEPLVVRLRWGAKTAELAEKGANLISYSLYINGELVSNLEQYRKPAVFVQAPILEQDNSPSWWVYWDYLILEPKREIIVTGHIVANEEIDNGWNIISAGYEDTFSSTIDLRSLFQID
ncbi:MAG: hypothetical protein FIB03_16455 [Anaerolineae bacterium]|nr:hypothetical protein [Anaerolineae bacterium]